jgi:hypothetical protein
VPDKKRFPSQKQDRRKLLKSLFFPEETDGFHTKT